MEGDTIKITESEYQNLLGKQGLIFIKSIGQAVNTARISRIVPEMIYWDEQRKKRLENRAASKNGMLHDGTKVIRWFGQWYLDDGTRLENPVTGQADKPEKLIDPRYYPEVAKDLVPTIEEYMIEYEQLLPKQRLEKMLNSRPDYTRYLKAPTSFKEILETSAKRIDELHKETIK